jgi:hypothetical protein
MNMPFELGVDYGAREFGRAALRDKRCLILGAERYDYQKALSDLSGVDIKSHDEEPETLVRVVRDWFFETGDVRPAPSWKELWFAFNELTADLYRAGKRQRLSAKELDMMSVAEYIHLAQQWHSAKQRAASRPTRLRSGRSLRPSARR